MKSIRTNLLVLFAAGVLLGQDVQHAIDLQKKGDFAGAAEAYRGFLSDHPNEAAIHSNLGVVLSQLGRFEEAEHEYSEALRLSPGNPGIELNLALAYYKSGRIPEAAKELETIAPSGADNAQVVLLRADCFLRMGDNKKVIELLRPLREKDPDNLGVAYVYGMALIRDQRIEEGQVVLDRILKDANSAEAHFLLGSQMFAAGDFPGAVREFQAAAERNPDLPSLQSYYGQALLNTGDPDGAAAAFRKELARDPIDFDSNLRLAEILIERKKPEEAAPLLERAASVRPDSAQVAFVRNGHSSRTSILIGKEAPGFTLSDVRLDSFRGKSPVLLVFGSYSCPNFRAAAPAINNLYERYRKQVPFLMVYIREAHSTADWQSTRNEREGVVIEPAKTMDEKSSHASMCVRKLNIPFPAVVDGMDGKVEADYQAWPSHAYLVDAKGIIRYSTGLTELDFHADELERAIQEVAK
jgi:Flp pilus assembly protein TadD/peroxiredoxin